MRLLSALHPPMLVELYLLRKMVFLLFLGHLQSELSLWIWPKRVQV